MKSSLSHSSRLVRSNAVLCNSVWDKRAIFTAAAHAQRDADFLLKLQETKEGAAAQAMVVV
jgi:antirestriction protein ArdC